MTGSTRKAPVTLGIFSLVLLALRDLEALALTPPSSQQRGSSVTKTTTITTTTSSIETDRRTCLSSIFLMGALTATAVLGTAPQTAKAAAAVQDSLDIDNFLRTGIDSGGNIGVSSQAGKSKPLTGVIFRDGSDVQQDPQGSVLAEILTGKKEDPKAILVSFVSPWKLQSGTVFDVECRDGNSADNAFLAVTQNTGGKSLKDLPSSFFLERLFDPTGRFSLYGPPTDIKVKKSRIDGNRLFMELGFSNLSQATAAEIPRKALLVATIPEGSENAVMLVGSTTASRWKRGGEKVVTDIVDSFQAIPAPKSNLKIRPKRDDRYDF